jgi:hypothetical protein
VLQLPFDRGEGVVERVHEQPGHDVDDGDPAPVAKLVGAGALARRAGREVDGAQQARVGVDRGDDLALIPDMIAGGDAVDAGGIEALTDLVGDAEPGRRVLAVDGDEVEGEGITQARNFLDHRVAARPTEDIAAKKHPHQIVLVVRFMSCIRSGRLR